MRFLHTADWHIGKMLRGRSRMDEYAAALDELGRLAIASRVDAILVAGDVFDSAAPPPEAEKLVYDLFARLLPERIACLVIAGNHDHPKKLEALAGLLEGLRIYVRAEVRPPDRGGVVALTSRDGNEEARIAVLPFVPERRAVDACRLLEPEHAWREAYGLQIAEILAQLTRGFTPRTVNLALGHLLIQGALAGSGERPLHLARVYAVEAGQIPANLQYMALGHLHRPQEVPAPSRTLYAGSLVELDFGERDQDKRVVLVEARPGGQTSVESIPLCAGRRLRDLEGTVEELADLSSDRASEYLRVTVRVEAPTPGIAEQVKQRLPNALEVRLSYPREPARPMLTPSRRLDPAQLFAEFYRRRNGTAPSREMLRLFLAAHEEATSG